MTALWFLFLEYADAVVESVAGTAVAYTSFVCVCMSYRSQVIHPHRHAGAGHFLNDGLVVYPGDKHRLEMLSYRPVATLVSSFIGASFGIVASVSDTAASVH
jgi:hypothetical protein